MAIKVILKNLLGFIALTACFLVPSLSVQSKTASLNVIPLQGNPLNSVINTYSYNSDSPFFNEYMENVYTLDNDSSIDVWFDTLPESTNRTNFSSLYTTTYNNINGKDVMVDTFYRHVGESLNDPNFGEGILIYQCIQYKVAHPDEDVEIYYASYRTSVTASVCVDRNSKYFGYMRSQFETEYDNHGFIRISFMLVEAARMGIKVVVVPQLNSYGVNQYSSSAAKKYASKAALSYKTYFNGSLSKNCYSQYANGKKVSDYFTFGQVDWDVETRGEDMQHIKTCLVSNYLDKDGVKHDYGCFYTSSNLDENDYLGRNGNTGSQSGVIITNHFDIYNVTKNYLEKILQYKGVDDVMKFRNYVSYTQTQQVSLINQGLGDTIPLDKRLVYLGSENDDVFEMYFTPIPGPIAVWDKVNNPYCKYLSEMLSSTGPIVFTWNMPYNSCTKSFEFTVEDVICESFHKNKNPNNVLYMHFESFSADRYNDLIVGEDIGFLNVNKNLNKYIHSKDMVMSYEKEGERKYVSIISSCNFGFAPFWYRSNSILVIKETDKNHGVYTSLGTVSTFGAITDDEGLSLNSIQDRYTLKKRIDTVPLTYEAWIDCNADVSNNKGCTIIGNYENELMPGISFRVYLDGRPQLNFRYGPKQQDQFTINQSILNSGKAHIAYSVDNTYVYGYLNGQQLLKKAHRGYLPELNSFPFSVGGDVRNDNSWWFRNGEIYSINLFKSYRTVNDIANDMAGVDYKNKDLIVSFDFAKGLSDHSTNHNDIEPYLYKGEFIEPSEYDYTFAAVGDTQWLSYEHKDKLSSIYDFLSENSESMKIKNVFGLGDITEHNTEDEWLSAKQNIYKLYGKTNFTLVRGNHDIKYDSQEEKETANKQFENYFDNDIYRTQIDGCYNDNPTNSYKIMQIGDINYLFINLDYGPSDDVLNWASSVVSNYPEHMVVVSTHAFLFRDGTTLDSNDVCPPKKDYGNNNGDELWDKFVSKHSNIFLVLCGHDPSSDVVHSTMIGDNGNKVTCLLINAQYVDKYIYPTGMIALLHFSNDGQRIDFEYYSTIQKKFYKSTNQFSIYL